MITWGINALNHGSSLAVFANGRLSMFESCKSDHLDSSLIHRAFNYGGPAHIFWYERPWLKKIRQAKAGQWHRVVDLEDLPRRYLNKINIKYAKLHYTPHHGSHAAAGYYTSPFNHAAIIVLDAIGEFECATIWEARYGEIKKVWSRNYPNSLGLFYSAFAHLIGLKPILEEHIFQQMSDKGDSSRFYSTVLDYMLPTLRMPKNLHQGVTDWPHPIETEQDRHDIAAAVQEVFERQIELIHNQAKKLTGAESLVYMGGCAMNSKANKKIVEPMWKYRWSLPQPGDPSSSIGAVLYHERFREWDWKFGVVKHMEISV